MLEADGFLHWNSSVAGLSALREFNVETVSLASGSRPPRDRWVRPALAESPRL